MPGDKTEAELQLQRKYQLLKQKKLQQQQQQKPGAGKPPGTSGGAKDAPKVDPARQAAIEALKRKRAAEAAAKGEAPPPEASPSPAGAPEPSSKPASGLKIKLGGGFKIPKRQTEHTAAQASAAAAKPPPAPAAAAATAAAAAAEPKADPKATLKRPALRRPVFPRPSATGDEPAAKRPQLDQAQQAHHDAAPEQNSIPGYPGAPSVPQLWVGNLPPEWTSTELFEFFGSFHDVVNAHVAPDMCYGFVTFGSYADAAAVLEFQQNQPVQVHDRELSIAWAKEGSGEGRMGGPGGGGQSKIAAARAAAAQVAEQIDHYALAEVNLAGPPPARNLVSYDDL